MAFLLHEKMDWERVVWAIDYPSAQLSLLERKSTFAARALGQRLYAAGGNETDLGILMKKLPRDIRLVSITKSIEDGYSQSCGDEINLI